MACKATIRQTETILKTWLPRIKGKMCLSLVGTLQLVHVVLPSVLVVCLNSCNLVLESFDIFLFYLIHNFVAKLNQMLLDVLTYSSSLYACMSQMYPHSSQSEYVIVIVNVFSYPIVTMLPSFIIIISLSYSSISLHQSGSINHYQESLHSQPSQML